MLPLITDEHKHVRRFAGPTFAYLLRRTEEAQLRNWVYHMLSEVRERHHVAFTETMSGIILETVKQIGHTFHSKTTTIILEIVAQQIGIDRKLHHSSRSKCTKLALASLDMFARELLLMMFNHGRKETVQPLWDWISNLLSMLGETEQKNTSQTINIALGFVSDAIALRNGSRYPGKYSKELLFSINPPD